MGLLHGLPISVKEHIGMKELGLNTGLVAWAGKIAEDDALILKILWKAGCVYYVRTTEPETLVSMSCCLDQLALLCSEHGSFTTCRYRAVVRLA